MVLYHIHQSISFLSKIKQKESSSQSTALLTDHISVLWRYVELHFLKYENSLQRFRSPDKTPSKGQTTPTVVSLPQENAFLFPKETHITSAMSLDQNKPQCGEISVFLAESRSAQHGTSKLRLESNELDSEQSIERHEVLIKEKGLLYYHFLTEVGHFDCRKDAI